LKFNLGSGARHGVFCEGYSAAPIKRGAGGGFDAEVGGSAFRHNGSDQAAAQRCFNARGWEPMKQETARIDVNALHL
jgi:hypothetical protein